MNEIAWAFWIGGGALVGFGVVLLAWAVFWDRARGRRRCPKCWYDMAGTPGLTCPECGRTAKRERRLSRTRRKRGLAGVALMVILTGGVAMRVPWALREGWTRVVPRPVLALLLTRFNESAVTAANAAMGMGTAPGVPTRVATGVGVRLTVPLGPASPPKTVSTWDGLLQARGCAVLIDRVGAAASAEVPALSVRAELRHIESLGVDWWPARESLRRAIRSHRFMPQELDLLEVLVRRGPSDEDRVPCLIDGLHAGSPDVRRWSADRLGRMGSQARSAIDALREVAMNDEDRVVQMAASTALSYIRRTLPAEGEGSAAK